YNYALRLLGNADLAEECVSETFSRFLQAVKKGGGPSENTKAYLYRVAHNWITDFYRYQKPEDTLESHASDPLEESPASIIFNNYEHERVRKALLQLTPEQRQVILLRFYEEWPHEEIGLLVGKSAEATRALQYRAIARLRKMLNVSED
ncbi:MAG: sigma-70 family RNA polymerase sigma factor, partial [Anaerolineales bacterium]|nr:sigma-70 family RNA polymerase sigma factor [Anaerolineales bacterium]